MKQNKVWTLLTSECKNEGTFADSSTPNSCSLKYGVFLYNRQSYNLQTTQDIDKYDGKTINMVRDGVVQFSNYFQKDITLSFQCSSEVKNLFAATG